MTNKTCDKLTIDAKRLLVELLARQDAHHNPQRDPGEIWWAHYWLFLWNYRTAGLP